MTPATALLLAAASAGSVAGAPQRPDDSTTARYEVAGLQVIHRAAPASAVVAVRLYLLGGTRQLSAATAGIEAMLLDAAAHDAERSMALAGAITTLNPDVDWTLTGFVVLKEDLDPAWAAFGRWIAEPALSAGSPSDAAIGRARAGLASAARRRYSRPDSRLQALAAQSLFPDHPYGLDPEGTEESLQALQRSDLERYAREQLVTSRMLLVVVGDVTRARVESLAGATLGRLPRGDYRWTLPDPVPQRPGRALIEHRALPTNYILGYFTGPSPRERDYTAFWIATQLLSSQLGSAVRRERSLSYAAFAPFLDRAIPVGGVYASSSDPAEVYRLMHMEIMSLQNLPLYGPALSRFLDQFTIDRLAQQLTAEGQAESLGRAQLYHGDHRVADQHVSRLRRVSPEHVRLAAARYMRHLQFAYVGDTTLMRGRW